MRHSREVTGQQGGLQEVDPPDRQLSKFMTHTREP